LGCWYNHRTFDSPYGLESFPHLEYWKTLPGLVADGIKFTKKHGTRMYSHYHTHSNTASVSGSAGAKKEVGESVEKRGLLSESNDS